MAVVMLAVVLYGFSRTVDKALLHSSRPDRAHIFVHGVVFLAWMLFFLVQCVLVRVRRVGLHRALGWWGVGNGVLVVVMGVWITVVSPTPRVLWWLGAVSVLGFGIPFGLAVLWRRKPDRHARLMLMATAMLTNAAFARFPAIFFPTYAFYAWVDVLILAGVVADLMVERRVHPVYRWGLPAFVLAEAAVMLPLWRLL